METKLKIEKKDLNASPITEEHSLFFGKVFRGKSAYQYAVDSGLFSGTEEEFAEYLGNIHNITEASNEATAAAIVATKGATQATTAAREAKEAADSATERATQATAGATTATENAIQATANTNEAIARATQATEGATNATNEAKDATNNANTAAQRANEEVENLREKADIDKYYPLMSVGMADNLVGRGDVQDAQINFRPSGGVLGVGNGMNITDGAARIGRIKGNSVVYNQMRYDNIVGNKYNFNVTRQERVYTFSDAAEIYAKITLSDESILGHKYLLRCNVVANDYSTAVITSNTTSMRADALILSSSGWAEAIVTKNISASNNAWQFQIYDSDYTNKSATLEDLIIIDLTQMFGNGYEPTTVEEYYQRKPMNIEDEFAYNEGELIDMKVDSLISISDNAYDYTKGYAKVMGGHTYSISANDAYIPDEVLFSTNADEWDEALTYNEEGVYNIPRDGYVKPIFLDVDDNLNICVCLQHSYDKPHPPYQQEVKDLSFIGEEFSEGMRCIPPFKDDIGIIVISEYIFDEIRFNTAKKVWEKIIRIGVVDLGNLSWVASSSTGYAGSFRAAFAGAKNYALFSPMYVPQFKSNQTTTWIPESHPFRANIYNGNIGVNNPDYTDVTTFTQAMKGVLLYYELAEPIIEEIEGSENWNLDYLVWDFGTEEAIATEPSAPFRADINYEPNAVDDLRWAVNEIRSLRAQLEQMSANVTNLTEV